MQVCQFGRPRAVLVLVLGTFFVKEDQVADVGGCEWVRMATMMGRELELVVRSEGSDRLRLPGDLRSVRV